jgi:hypothetical protein
MHGMLPIGDRPLPPPSKPDPNFRLARAFMTDEEREQYDRDGTPPDSNDEDDWPGSARAVSYGSRDARSTDEGDDSHAR